MGCSSLVPKIFSYAGCNVAFIQDSIEKELCGKHERAAALKVVDSTCTSTRLPRSS